MNNVKSTARVDLIWPRPESAAPTLDEVEAAFLNWIKEARRRGCQGDALVFIGAHDGTRLLDPHLSVLWDVPELEPEPEKAPEPDRAAGFEVGQRVRVNYNQRTGTVVGFVPERGRIRVDLGYRIVDVLPGSLSAAEPIPSRLSVGQRVRFVGTGVPAEGVVHRSTLNEHGCVAVKVYFPGGDDYVIVEIPPPYLDEIATVTIDGEDD